MNICVYTQTHTHTYAHHPHSKLKVGHLASSYSFLKKCTLQLAHAAFGCYISRLIIFSDSSPSPHHPTLVFLSHDIKWPVYL